MSKDGRPKVTPDLSREDSDRKMAVLDAELEVLISRDLAEPLDQADHGGWEDH